MLHLPWISHAMLPPQIAPTRSLLHIAILHQRGSILRGSGSQVQSHQGQRAHSFTPRQEFIRPELIRLDGVPGLVERARPLFLRPHAIQPVVPGNKIPSRITDDRNSHLVNFVEHILTKSADVGELRPRIVNALVNRPPQMLKKRPEQIAVERSDRSSRIDVNPRSRGGIASGSTLPRAAGRKRRRPQQRRRRASHARARSLFKKPTSGSGESIHGIPHWHLSMASLLASRIG